ncbi:MAG: hypothetical protein PHQ86_03320 [Dehalococcoidales bacterium]|nr:hypothetical protein [Dehalococcoidales bacterium]
MIYIIIPPIIVVGILGWILRPRKSMTKRGKIAVLITTISQLFVAIVTVIFQLLHNAAGRTEVSDISNICFEVGVGLVGGAILAVVGFAIRRKWEIAKGIGFGICIAIIVLILELYLLEWLGGV